MAFIVTGGVIGIALGAGIGGALGYKLGVYSAWRLVTSRLGKGEGANMPWTSATSTVNSAGYSNGATEA